MTFLESPYVNNVSTGVFHEFDEPFQLSVEFPALIVYTFELEATAPLLSTEDVSVKLYIASDPDPTIEVSDAYLASAQLAGIGLVSIQTVSRQVVTGWVPPGYYAKISMIATGTATATLVNALEVVFDNNQP